MFGLPIAAEYVGDYEEIGNLFNATEIIFLIHKYAFDYLLIPWVTNCKCSQTIFWFFTDVLLRVHLNQFNISLSLIGEGISVAQRGCRIYQS